MGFCQAGKVTFCALGRAKILVHLKIIFFRLARSIPSFHRQCEGNKISLRSTNVFPEIFHSLLIYFSTRSRSAAATATKVCMALKNHRFHRDLWGLFSIKMRKDSNSRLLKRLTLYSHLARFAQVLCKFCEDFRSKSQSFLYICTR